MKIEELQLAIKGRLAKGLPGKDAHMKMFPKLLTGSRLKFERDQQTRVSGVMILLYQGENEVLFPLIQRPTYNGVHSGQMSFPGGKQEDDDRDTIHTAIRETEEEIGISGKQIQIIGNLSEHFVGASNSLVLPVLGYSNQPLIFTPDEFEVSEIVEASIAELLDENIVKEKIIEVGDGRLKLNSPYFDIKGKVVWGATAVMLNEFKEILKDIYGYA